MLWKCNGGSDTNCCQGISGMVMVQNTHSSINAGVYLGINFSNSELFWATKGIFVLGDWKQH